jgi:glycolate oxidase FAD binding subunit
VVDGRGTALHVGGRVVKNVAGFDLVRLFTGSHGTLGAIVEATVRLRARPAVETTLALGVTPATLADVARALRAPVLAPLACEYVGAALATRLGLAARACVLVRIGGNAPFVRAQREAVASLAPATELPVATWSALQAIALDAPVSYRVTGPVRDIAARVAAEEGRDWHGAEALVQASLGRGLVRVTVPVVAGDMRAPAIARADDRLHLDCAPHAWWATWPDPFATPLARRVRDAFDPRRVCNRTDVPLVGTPHG